VRARVMGRSARSDGEVSEGVALGVGVTLVEGGQQG